MIEAWIAFAWLISVGFWLAFWCESVIAFVMLSAFLLLVLIFAILNRVIKPQIDTDIQIAKNCDKGQTVKGKMILKNQRILLYRRAKVNVAIHNMLTDEETFENINAVLYPKSESSLSVKLQSRYCGTVYVACKKIRLYDFFGLTWRTVKTDKKAVLIVLPDVFAVDVDLPMSNENLDNQSYAENICGDDISEVYDYREYVPGDNIGHIQWKLSEKHGCLMIKRGSLPLNRAVSLCMVLGDIEEPQKRSDTAEMTVSVSQSLCESGMSHAIILGEEKFFVDSQDDLAALLPSLLSYKKTKLSDDILNTDNVLLITSDEDICGLIGEKAMIMTAQSSKER